MMSDVERPLLERKAVVEVWMLDLANRSGEHGRLSRYFAARVRTAQVIPNPTSTDIVAFGSTVTFSRDNGRVQKYRIVGEDEANPKAGSISFVSPVARLLMGKAVGDEVSASGVKTLRSFRSRSTSICGILMPVAASALSSNASECDGNAP